MAFEYPALMDSVRVILYHKQSTSAMTRFFKLDDGGVALGHPLPQLCRIVTDETGVDSAVVPHPAAIVAEMERWLGLSPGNLEVDPEYHERIEVPGDILRVYLARFKSIDPPFSEAEAVGASFVPLTQARDVHPVELELLRSAYTVIMEG